VAVHVGVLENRGIHGEAITTVVRTHGRRRMADRRDDFDARHQGRGTKEGQRRRRADVGRNDDDHHAHVHRVRGARADGRQRTVDQHTCADAVGNGRVEKVGWPRPRKDYVRSHQQPCRTTASVPTRVRLQIGKRCGDRIGCKSFL